VRDGWASVLLWLVKEEPKQQQISSGDNQRGKDTAKAKSDEFYFAFEWKKV
jgi:hypothetical protein